MKTCEISCWIACAGLDLLKLSSVTGWVTAAGAFTAVWKSQWEMQMTQWCSPFFQCTLSPLPLTASGGASLSVRACDYRFRNEPKNKTLYCDDTNLAILANGHQMVGIDGQLWFCTAVISHANAPLSLNSHERVGLLGTCCFVCFNHW